MHPPTTVHIEGIPSQLWHAGKKLCETTLIPLGLFYLLFSLTDLNGGLFAALGWAVAALASRLVLRVRVPAVLIVTTGLLVIRTVIAMMSQSTFLYFLQPSLANFLIAFALLVSIPFERTFLARLADDFCVFPPALVERPGVQRFFRRVSLLWAAVFLVKGVTTLYTLWQSTIEQFLLVNTAGSYVLMAMAAGVSLLWFRRELRGEGIRLSLRKTPRLPAGSRAW